ncbi:MAG: hypothetical protein EZS28_039013, partial [Streblomastix strix]
MLIIQAATGDNCPIFLRRQLLSVKWFNNTEDNSCPVLNMWVFMILGIICVIVPICIYSALLNPQGSFAYAQITARREPYRETADYLAKDARIYDNNTLVASSMGAAWIEYYFNKRNYQIPANVVSLHKLNYFVANGQEIEATQLTKTQLLSFKYLYLFEVKQIIPKDFMDLLDNKYTMVKEIAGLSSPIIATEQPSKPTGQMLNKKYTTYDILSICALAFMLLFMLAFASRQSLWRDELYWTVGIITGEAFNNQGMFRILLEQLYNLPLYYVIVKPLYYILPYGEIFLRMPSILFAFFGVIILANTAKKIGGKELGLYTLCIALTSSILITQGGWEFRPYSLMFFCAALTLLMFINRLQQETNKNIICHGLALLLLVYSHCSFSVGLSYCGYIRIRTAVILKTKQCKKEDCQQITKLCPPPPPPP